MYMIHKDYFTAEEFATLRGVHVKTVYRWVKSASPPPHEVLGRMVWISRKGSKNWNPPKAGRQPKQGGTNGN